MGSIYAGGFRDEPSTLAGRTSKQYTFGSHQRGEPAMEPAHPQIKAKYCPECRSEFASNSRLSFCPSDNTLLALSMDDPLVGQTAGAHYEIEAIIGLGGWGTVYQAKHKHLSRKLAIKVLHGHLAGNADKVKRFQREAEALMGFAHPNLVAVHDFGLLPDGRPFLVMDFVEGNTLAQIIQERGSLSWLHALPIFLQLADALGAAHEKGIIHRDLKPSNVIVVTGENDKSIAKLVDFGLMRIISSEDGTPIDFTETGDVLGTPSYMSPEQCLGQTLDARSDIYSFGCLMYEVITGKKAFTGRTALECMQKQLGSWPKPLKHAKPGADCPASFDYVLLKSLAKDPAERYQSMSGLTKDLSNISKIGAGKLIWQQLKHMQKTVVLQTIAVILAIIAGPTLGYFIVQSQRNTASQSLAAPVQKEVVQTARAALPNKRILIPGEADDKQDHYLSIAKLEEQGRFDNPDLPYHYSRLGDLYSFDKPAIAEKHLRRALELRAKLPGKHALEDFNDLDKLFDVCLKQSQFFQCQQILDRLKDLNKKGFSSDKQKQEDIAIKQAELEREMGNLKQAVITLKAVLIERSSRVGKNSPELLSILRSMQKISSGNDAVKCNEQIINIDQHGDRFNRTILARDYQALATSLENAGRKAEADKCWQKSLLLSKSASPGKEEEELSERVRTLVFFQALRDGAASL